MFLSFIGSLKTHLSQTLPGQPAQFEMAPEGRKNQFSDLSKIKGYRESAVCLFLFERKGQIFFPLIERMDYSGVHSGQLALPGGKVEVQDKDFIDAALREMSEETGIICPRENVIGRLTNIYIPPSNFMVETVVACSGKTPAYHLNKREVKSIIEFGLHELLNDAIIKETTLTVQNGLKIKAPYFEVQGKILWGATAMILNEFKTILKRPGIISSYPIL